MYVTADDIRRIERGDIDRRNLHRDVQEYAFWQYRQHGREEAERRVYNHFSALVTQVPGDVLDRALETAWGQYDR